MNHIVIEIAGYLAPLALVVAFFFKNMKVLRSVNTLGCLFFVVYGVGVGAWPVVAANVIISLTNIFYLIFSRELKFIPDVNATNEQKGYMRQAIKLAMNNVSDNNGGPFGSVIVKDGQVIAAETNHVISSNDPTSHAEVNAIREACRKLNTFDLSGCEIYTSCEPGPLSLSAIYWAHIDKVYYAANRSEAAAVGFDDSPIYDELGRHMNKRRLPISPLLQSEGKAPLAKWKETEGKVKY